MKNCDLFQFVVCCYNALSVYVCETGEHKIQRYVSNCQSSEYSQLHAVATEIENCLRSNVHCRCVDEDCSGIGVR